MSGSYAYVAALNSDSLVVVDISNPATPAIRGSVVSASLLDGVRVTLFCDRGRPQAPLHASTSCIMLALTALPPAGALSRPHLLALTCAVCTGG